MARASVLILCCLWARLASAQLAIESCTYFAWDCPQCPEVGAFRLYASQTSGQYDFVRLENGLLDPSKSRPTLTIPNRDTLVTQTPCNDLALMLPTEGQWFAVLTYVTQDWSQESPPSNEVSFRFRNQLTLPPIDVPPVPPRRPPAPLPPAPKPPPVANIPPVVHRSDAPFTQTEMFQGIGRTAPPTRMPTPLPPPCQDPPGTNFTESCLFRGAR